MKDLKAFEFWFVTGSQDLYGEETLRQVAEHTKEMVAGIDSDPSNPCKLVWKPTVLTAEAISKIFAEANADEKCAGIICWMHTFSPAKMWIAGLSVNKKPLLQ